MNSRSIDFTAYLCALSLGWLYGGLSLIIFITGEAFSITFSSPFSIASIPSFEAIIGVK